MDYGIETLISLDGLEYTYENGYWYRIEANIVSPTKERPHGLRYNLTFHNKYNKRIFGMDNAHGVKAGRKFQGRLITYDHLHKDAVDQGTPYEFDTAEKLLEDFFKHIDKVLGAIKWKR